MGRLQVVHDNHNEADAEVTTDNESMQSASDGAESGVDDEPNEADDVGSLIDV